MIFIFSVENKKFNFSENNRLEKTDNNKSIEEGVTSFCGFINYAQLVNETVTHIEIYILRKSYTITIVPVLPNSVISVSLAFANRLFTVLL